VDTRFNAEEFWCTVQKERYCNAFLDYDRGSYDFIKDLIKKNCEKLDADHIYFGQEHDSILTFLCQNETLKDCIFNVFNVDHHHDVFYGLNQRDEVERFNYATISDWVWYLFINKKLNNYYWVNNESSDEASLDKLALLHQPFEKILWFKNRRDALFDVDFDYIYICKSERFFPIQFYDLFYELMDMVGTLKNTEFKLDVEEYCLGKKSRNPIK